MAEIGDSRYKYAEVILLRCGRLVIRKIQAGLEEEVGARLLDC